MQIPQIGLGTWQMKGDSGQKSVLSALELGYRHLDTADWYKNHDIVGDAIKQSSLKRSEIYLVTKIFPPLKPEKILEDGQRFLDELQTNYIDLLLVHWPDRHDVLEVLEAFSSLKDDGVTHQIGVSNFSIAQINKATKAGYPIYNHQWEVYPGNIDQQMAQVCEDNNITMTAYSPLGEGNLLKNKSFVTLCEKHRLKPAQAALRYLMDLGYVVIPKASSREHQKENLEAVRIELPDEFKNKLDEGLF